MVGEELEELGASTIVGIDLLPEAAAAAVRDRPGVYDDYCVWTSPSSPTGCART